MAPLCNRQSIPAPLAPLSYLSHHLLPPPLSLPTLTFGTLFFFFPSFQCLYLLILLHNQLFTSRTVRYLMFCFDKTNKLKWTEGQWLIAGHLQGHRRPCPAGAVLSHLSASSAPPVILRLSFFIFFSGNRVSLPVFMGSWILS